MVAGETKYNSIKKGSNILCRVANPSPQKVCEYVHRLPKCILPEEKFRELMGKQWFANEHQAPEQWGLYYIDGINYYPRFKKDISEKEAENYLYNWMKNLIVINPYTRFKKENDNPLILSIVHQLESNPSNNNLITILTNLIGKEEPLIVNEILVNAINTYSEVLKIEKINNEYCVNLVPNYQTIINTKYKMNKKDYFELFGNHVNFVSISFISPLQQIYYGAPGTGKSYAINKVTKEYKGNEQVIRTTFHPDSDYSTFVGAYKPTMEEVDTKVVPVVMNNGISMEQNSGTYREKRITYKFVPQAFTKAYINAWKLMTEASNDKVEPQFLIIEEINRGNCAQIFGDLFQLLDRDENGYSEYPVNADDDLKRCIATELVGCDSLPVEVRNGSILKLPPNLYIWATMNTSDQSLFPIDSAFKRRWEWKYIPISNANMNWKVKVGESKYDWWNFLEAINKKIYEANASEDKQLGYFFARAKNNEISAETFVNKVIFFLWNDVFKDFDDNSGVFKKSDSEGSLTFRDFFNQSGDANLEVIQGFMKNLGISADDVSSTVEDDEEYHGEEDSDADVVEDKSKWSEIEKMRYEFWEKFLEYAKQNDEFAKYYGGVKKPSRYAYKNFFIYGVTQFHFDVIRQKRENAAEVQVYFGERNDAFNRIFAHREEIEQAMGVEYEWVDNPNNKTCKISEKMSDVNYEDAESEKKVFDFFIDRLLRMREVFGKYATEFAQQ